MAKVADLKNHARDLERQGQIAKSLAIYRHIIKHLEGTPHILRELALYVKTGDLALKTDDAPAAIESYERAAEHYATHGSVNSVIALCQKILRIAPERKGVHARFARLLLDQGHVAGARDVLIEYAESAQLNYALETLRGLRERSDDDAKPALEALLEAAEGGQDAEMERTSKEVVPLLFSPTAELAARMSAPTFTKREEPPSPPPEPPPLVQEPIGNLSQLDAPKTSEAGAPKASEAAAPPDDDQSIPKIEPTTGPSLRVPTPRQPKRGLHRRVPFGSRAARQTRSGKKWVIAVIAILSFATAGVLAFMGIVPIPNALRFGAASDPAEPVSSAPTSTQSQQLAVNPATTDTGLSAVVDDTAAAAVGDTLDSLPSVAGLRAIDTLRNPRDSTIGQLARTDTLGAPQGVADPVVDTTQPSPPALAPVDTTAAQPTTSRETILAIFGLPVDSVTLYAAGGLGGYRVHQTLRTGEQVLLAVLPLGSDATDTVGVGPIFVNLLSGDTVIGTARFGQYSVSATGTVATTVLDSLMQQIAARRAP